MWIRFGCIKLTVALDLMPVNTEAPRCSEFARSIGVLPPGSGLFLDRVVLVSAPLPWPKPALKHEILQAAASLVAGSPVSSRLFAMEPASTAEPMGDAKPVNTHIEVEVYERSGATTRQYQWQAAHAEGLAEVVAAIADCPIGSLGELPTAKTMPSLVPPTFLICTQGSHDSCCGTSGVALADEIEATRPDYVVRRVSHTGGHRFSPTFLAFPEGRMWAFADIDLVDRIATDSISSSDVILHARGWWGAKAGPAQAAECAVRAERAGAAFVEPHIEPVVSDDRDSVNRFRVTSDSTTWDVHVRVERAIPSIACESPGGLPVKPGREFAWTIEST